MQHKLTNGGLTTKMTSSMSKKVVTGKVLGNLESEIMEIIWSQRGDASVKCVAEILSKKRQIAYTTVMTVMARLANKGVLVRHMSGASYLYKPKVTKDQFIAKAAHSIFSSAVSSLGDEVLAHFIKEIQRINPKKRQELLKILSEDKTDL
ncbi:TPA: CopY family transcriptional regulator [candidate division WWE3 bacterium]|uniref:CopY family transcriptional regulator n=1 Tax=candidate division WWE3 bacterium TaxID=2053526 RepID=A0A3D0ZS23_UNCKA|nr:CopY family transcriptional regulator [candidate division WWE3 bacterium]HCC42513.1 CopY family transcriptional regulator [candidate division WWE3 bacterium]